MPKFDYGNYMQKALRRMVGDVLGDVAENGLKGDQHFFITFRTKDKGVDIPPFLLDQFPEKMTIILQGWFDNLAVMDDRFFVTLSFSGIARDLVIPLHAIVSFADPSVNFELNFDNFVNEKDKKPSAEITEKSAPEAPQKGVESGKVISFDRFRKHEE